VNKWAEIKIFSGWRKSTDRSFWGLSVSKDDQDRHQIIFSFFSGVHGFRLFKQKKLDLKSTFNLNNLNLYLFSTTGDSKLNFNDLLDLLGSLTAHV
jgi:hypothetical protein